VRMSVTIDWTIREPARVRFRIRVMVRRVLGRHGSPPGLHTEATELVLEQAEALCAEWSANE
jgi:type I restriction enzyme, R subunit